MPVTPPASQTPPTSQVVIDHRRLDRRFGRGYIWVGLVGSILFAAIAISPQQVRVPEYDTDLTSVSALGWPSWIESSPGPDSLIGSTLTAVGDDFVVVGGPDTPAATLWRHRSGDDWVAIELPTIPYGLVSSDGRIVAFRGIQGWTIQSKVEPWTVSDGFDFPTQLRLGYGSGRPPVTPIDDGLLLQSLDGELIVLRDGEPTVVIEQGVWGRPSEGAWRDFTGPRNTGPCRVDTVVSNDYVPVAVGEDRVVAVVGGGDGRPHGLWPACGPRLWASVDGGEWAPLSDESPFGRVGYVSDIAWREGRFLAVGGIDQTARVWESTDAVTWTDATPRPVRLATQSFTLIGVEAGPAGWAIVAEESDRSHYSGWVSPQGDCWFRIPTETAGRVIAVGTEGFAVAGGVGVESVWLGEVPEDNRDPCEAG